MVLKQKNCFKTNLIELHTTPLPLALTPPVGAWEWRRRRSCKRRRDCAANVSIGEMQSGIPPSGLDHFCLWALSLNEALVEE